MNTYQCRVDEDLRQFFLRQSPLLQHTVCINCGNEVGWCENCHTVAPLQTNRNRGHLTHCGRASIANPTTGRRQPYTATPAAPPITYRCGNPKCGATVVKCRNYYSDEHVCNRVLIPSPLSEEEGLCKACRLNDVIPTSPRR